MISYFKGKVGGHRSDYYKYFSDVLGYFEVAGFVNAIIKKGLMIFPMYEEMPVRIILISVARRIFFRKSVVLVFNPFYVTKLSFSSFKIFIASILDRVGVIYFVPILPAEFYNRQGISFRYHCIDPQFYDLCSSEAIEIHNNSTGGSLSGESSLEVKTVGFIGSVHSHKGLKYFLDFVSKKDNKYKFIVAGVMSKDVEIFLSKHNVHVVNAWVDEVDILEYYKKCNYIWCYFEPQYDQSSGTLGRAVQLKKIPILRKGSVLEKISRRYCSQFAFFDPNFNDFYVVRGAAKSGIELKYRISSVIKSIYSL